MSQLDTYVESIRKGLFLDESRTTFLQQNAQLLDQLAKGELIDRNRFRRLLLGRKAVGKTLLLQRMCQNVQIISPTIVAVYMTLDSNTTTPFRHIANQLGIAERIVSETTINEHLRNHNQKIFLVIDELQLLFTQLYENGFANQFIDELGVLGGSTEGTIHAIVTGSSTDLRRLCFAKMKMAEAADQYPNYRGVDLNSTKFQPQWIYPLVELKDFREFMQRFRPDVLEAEYAPAFFQSGGYPGLAREHGQVSDGASYSITSKGIVFSDQNSAEYRLLLAIFNWLLVRSAPHSAETLETVFRCTQLIPLSDISRELRDLPNIRGVAYDLADTGVIRFYDHFRFPSIGLGSALVYFELISTLYEHTISAVDAFALAIFDTAAEVPALRMLARSNKWLGFDFEHSEFAGSFELPRDPCPLHLPDVQMRLFKEVYDGNRDSFGTDAVVLQPLEQKALIVHRIQIKLGASSFKTDKLMDVGNRWKTHAQQVKQIYEALFPHHQLILKHHLVTTKGAAPQDIARLCQQYDCNFIGQKVLAEHVWPKCVKTLHQAYR